jgi:parvulin-like peptidyl-prolyl isomerase
LIGFAIFDFRFAISRSKVQNPKSKMFLVLCLLLAVSANVFPAEEDQSEGTSPLSKPQSLDGDSDSQQGKPGRTVSISTGPDGKVTWFFGKDLGTAHGDAVVEYEDVILKADHVWADLAAEVIEAQGNVKLEMKDQTITAEHMLFDLKDKKGMMKDGLSFDNPWYHSGKEMSRLNDEDSLIEKGAMTSCSLDHPHYFFEASQIVIHLKKELVAKHVVFKIGGIPLLYLPVYRRSLEEEKRSRFIFKIGSNTFEGYYVKNILPVRWRMIDGSVFFNYTSRRGRNGGVEFDYDADKMRLREIFLPVAEDASDEEWRAAREKIDEIFQRAQGELDKVWLKQIFIRFQIEEADKVKARERAAEILGKCREEGADFAQLARRWSDDIDTKTRGGYLGSFVMDERGISRREGEEYTPVEPALLPVIEAAFKLEPDQVSDLVETEEGYSIAKVDAKEDMRPESLKSQVSSLKSQVSSLKSQVWSLIQVRYIFVAFEPGKKAQEDAQDKADDILTKLSDGAEFEELAALYSDDRETRDKGGDLGWQTFQDLDISFHRIVRMLDKGEVSRPVTTSRGVYILKLEEKEETPDFADLAREHSQAPSAELGGDIGYRSRWEIPPEVRREAFRLEIGSISRPIRTGDGYRIVKVEKKRRLGGDVYVRYGDLYSYQVEKNPIKLGQTWDIDIHHNQTLWQGGKQRESDTAAMQKRMRIEKSLGMRAELSLAGKEFKQYYQSYNPERELRSYCALDYDWMSRTGSRGSARFIVDGTRDLLGEDTGLLQKYPDVSFRSSNYRLYEVQPFKKINSGLLFISDRIQGKTDFAELARKVSDDDRTKDKGGELGWFRKRESGMGTKVESIIFDPDPNRLDPGDVSEPIAVTDGYHIVKLEEVEGEADQRERARARHIFIAIDPDIRTKDEASKLADEIYTKLVEGDRPSLGFLTLDNTSFSFGVNAGNYYKDKYRDEENIWLQTADASATLSKRAVIRLGVTRELNLGLDGNYRQIWHSKTQTLRNSLGFVEEEDLALDLDRRDRNVFSSAWNAQASLSTDLHRIYRSVPGVYAMKHTISPYARFYYTPPGESEKRGEEKEPKLYPFGATTWTYERKQLTVGMTNSIDIKTKRKRERLSLFRWDLTAGADYTEDRWISRPGEEKEPGRRYEYVRNTFTLKPHEQLDITNVLVHNPNNIGTGEPLLWSFNSDLRYSDSERKWTGYLRRQYVYYQYAEEWKQFFTGKIDLRWSRNWSLSFELEYEYDKQVKDIYRMNVSMHRMLHCWESRIGFRRIGAKGGYIRKDFFFQIDILADPGKALGVGYDDVTKSWALRSLPGMGRVGGFLRPGYSTYY